MITLCIYIPWKFVILYGLLQVLLATGKLKTCNEFLIFIDCLKRFNKCIFVLNNVKQAAL